ncbi:tol-pal system protein YbgF [Hymenobacter aerilatus]|uniref:Tol-pal system protein YbgF n=1 Tax=Hymenobacter aerilatus TaxID=2932251 RepID=A0A8T9T5D4_9BACT|nr:tol-pal system protein YbgF [Hymenobacter aerilatus]UOR07306.1 tol-pal system protein YbgF [Hymenobacter aerilatus]
MSKTFYSFLLLLLLPVLLHAQQPDTISRQEAPIRNIDIENVDVLPSAAAIDGWLLLDKDIQTELDGAMHNLYNFKYDKAEKQFRSLRRRYPQHPMPYFLMGLTTWWKIMPNIAQTKQYDNLLFAYMDTAITYATRLYEADNKNYEACFFLAAAYGFDARLNGERHNWRRVTVSSKRALDYLEISKQANGLSPEFLCGQALINYYSVWLSETYKLLRPVLLFFPKGNQQLGIEQLRMVANNGFYAAPEAKYFLMKVLSEQKNSAREALAVAQQLHQTYPDNAYFERLYAMLCFNEGEFWECEKVSKDILDKLNRGLPGYEGTSGRYASYFMGWIMQNKVRNLAKAKEYYQRCIVFAESTSETQSGFYLYANLNLAHLANGEKDVRRAKQYYSVVAERAERKSDMCREAHIYLKNN